MQGVMRGIVAPSQCTHPESANPVETAAVWPSVCVLEEPLVAYPPVFFLRPGGSIIAIAEPTNNLIYDQRFGSV